LKASTAGKKPSISWSVNYSKDQQFAASKSEARRLIRQAAVSIDGEKIEDSSYRIDPKQKSAFVLRVGKRKFGRIKLE